MGRICKSSWQLLRRRKTLCTKTLRLLVRHVGHTHIYARQRTFLESSPTQGSWVGDDSTQGLTQNAVLEQKAFDGIPHHQMCACRCLVMGHTWMMKRSQCPAGSWKGVVGSGWEHVKAHALHKNRSHIGNT